MFIVKLLAHLLRLLTTLAFVAMGLVLVIGFLPFFDGAYSYPWVRRVVAFDTSLIEGVRSVMPTRAGRLDLARAFLALAMFLLGGLLDFGANSLTALATGAERRRRFGKRRARARRKKKERKTKERKTKKAAAAAVDSGSASLDGEKKSREELVRLMVEAKRELDAMSRHVAFLALDVVESTNMKLGEDRAFVEHDFREFKKMVEEELARQRPLKSAWTPDGAMICFESLDRAITAAQGMLMRLPAFNSDTRMMSTPFRVRCGVNAGTVQYDAEMPMEEMSDNVIDVAGHMQKYADPDTIFVATNLLTTTRKARDFHSAGTEVDGYEVSVWRGPSAGSAPAQRVPAAETRDAQ